MFAQRSLKQRWNTRRPGWFARRRLQRELDRLPPETIAAYKRMWNDPNLERQFYEPSPWIDKKLDIPSSGPMVWMEAECEDCPFRCPECDSDLTEYIHDGWECLVCGVVF